MNKFQVKDMVRCTAKYRYYEDGPRGPCPHTGKVGRVTEVLGSIQSHQDGSMKNFYLTDFSDTRISELGLEPYNPDNKVAGSFTDVMDSLNLETINA